MAFARSYSVTLVGLEGHVVEVQADLTQGLPSFILTGLPDASLSESRDRVRAAVANSGGSWPQRRVTVALLPAPLPKSGSGFDLAIAAAVLAAAGAVPAGPLADLVLVGELGLDGRVRGVRGVLPAVLAALREGRRTVLVPAANAAEAALVPGAEVVAVDSLAALIARLRGLPVEPPTLPDPPPPDAPDERDLRDVLGQAQARRALEIAAAGGHNLFMTGPPGVGKTMLAERLPGLLPDLEPDEALEVSAVHSLAGALPPGAGLVTRPPFAHPHHTASVPALVGGGSGLARPGAVSLAHRGVLFLDEAPEFPRPALDALRQPVEAGEVLLHRAAGAVRYPARFALVLAANPCPCGVGLDSGQLAGGCECPQLARRRYLNRLSGPLLDRIDLRVELRVPSRAELDEGVGGSESSAAVRERVLEARARARHRLRDTPWRVSRDVPGPELRRRWMPSREAMRAAWVQYSRDELSGRGIDRVLRVAWSVADLAGHPAPTAGDVAEALLLRASRTSPSLVGRSA